MLQLFQTHQDAGIRASLAQDIGRSGIVGHAIDPGAQGAPRFPGFETAPERQMDLLHEVAAVVGIGLVGACQAFQCGAVSGGGFAISVVLRSFHG